MPILTRAQIDAIDDISVKMIEVEVPEWGGSVFLRPLTVGELDEYSNAVVRAKPAGGLSDFRSRLVAYCLCDDKGNRLFTDAEVSKLAAKNAVVVERLYRACDELNDISPKKVEDVAGNSATGRSESSDSDSPDTSSARSQNSTECQQPSSASGGHSTSTLSHSAESGSKSGGSSAH